MRPDEPHPATLACLLTPPGRGGIAVICLAGPDAGRLLAAIFQPLKSHAQAIPGRLQLGRLMDGGQVIDEAVVCSRGQQVEINIHGGPRVARAVLELLSRLGAKVAASAGCHGLPLSHPRWHNPAIGAELLEALPGAAGPLVVAALSHQWSGGISRLARAARVQAQALRSAAGGLAVIRRLLQPPEVVLAGPPNAGKSTLINALVGRQVSIVHAAPGTTRDWVRELALLEGLPVWLTDTAGIWQVSDGVDAEAVRRARACAAAAELVLLLSSHDAPAGEFPCAGKPARPTRRHDAPAGEFPCAGKPARPTRPHDAPAGEFHWLPAAKTLGLWNKCDLCPPPAGQELAVCAASGQGLDLLKARILERLGLAGFQPAQPRAFTARQADLLTAAADALEAGDPASARRSLSLLLEAR